MSKDGYQPLKNEQVWGEPTCETRGVPCGLWDGLNSKCNATNGCVKPDINHEEHEADLLFS
jgi:hypothetical protein